MIVWIASADSATDAERFPSPANGNTAAMTVSDLVALPFRWGSALRGRRFFHPDGVLATGSVQRVAPAQCGLPVPSTEVIARFSKAVGTPGSLPDFIGLAIRINSSQSSPWDVLLVSAGSGALSRAVALRPVTQWSDQAMTSLMPFRYRGGTWWLRARIVSNVDGPGLAVASIRHSIEHGGVHVALDQARGTGQFQPLARLSVSSLVDAEADDVSFDPVLNTAPGLSLYPGWLADLRARSYQRSREGRETA
jgi:hypothetical protein